MGKCWDGNNFPDFALYYNVKHSFKFIFSPIFFLAITQKSNITNGLTRLNFLAAWGHSY